MYLLVMNSEAVLLFLFTVVSKQVNKNTVLVHMKQFTQKMHQDWFLF